MVDPLADPTLFPLGLRLFEAGEWYDAHHAWEALWLAKRKDPGYVPLQGLIQLAAAEFHLARGSHRPAGRLFRSVLGKLGGGDEYWNTPLEPFREQARAGLARIAAA